MARVILDFDPPFPKAPGFGGDQSDLVNFLSFAYAGRFGAQHELSLLALTLQSDFKINLRPLLNFADREVEEPEDEEPLANAWQDSLPLAETCEAITAVFATARSDVAAVIERYPALPSRIEELGAIARAAAVHDARIRVTYLMNGEQ